MGKYECISIKKAMENIVRNRYLLPAIQRKFVWDSVQIEMLFDSILRGYPISSFMFWHITDNDVKKNFTFYSFIKNYTQKFNEDNPTVDTNLFSDEFDAVIDGQQRLTSLYIGMSGTYRKKLPNKRMKDTEDALPTRKLYLELSSALESSIDNDKVYNFVFLSERELNDDKSSNPDHFWFKVGDVLNFSALCDVNEYLSKNNLTFNPFASKALTNLFSRVHVEELINYYTIDEQDQDTVLDVFIRANSGGTPLSFSDLLMSIASANWTKYDARDEMSKLRKEINAYGNPNFEVSQDFVLKTILVLSDADIRFKIKNFGRNNITVYEENWKGIRESLLQTFELLELCGFNNSTLRAKNAAIPIAYFIYKNNLRLEYMTSKHMKNRELITKWLSLSLLKGIFGGHSDGVLKDMRKVIANSTGDFFPAEELYAFYRDDPMKNYSFNDEVISSLLDEEYGSTNAALVLALLYPNVVSENDGKVAQDHMHPKTIFETPEKRKEAKLDSIDVSAYNTVLNLQLLGTERNAQKGDDALAEWAKDKKLTPKDLFAKSDTSLEIKDCVSFWKARKEVLSKELKRLLNV